MFHPKCPCVGFDSDLGTGLKKEFNQHTRSFPTHNNGKYMTHCKITQMLRDYPTRYLLSKLRNLGLGAGAQGPTTSAWPVVDTA